MSEPVNDWQHGKGIWKVVRHRDGHINMAFGPVADLHPIARERIIWQGEATHPSQALAKAREAEPHLFKK